MLKTALAGLFLSVSVFANAGIIGNSITFEGGLGTQVATIGNGIEFSQDWNVIGINAGDNIDIFEGGFTLTLWSGKDRNMFDTIYGDFWNLTNLDFSGQDIIDIVQVSGPNFLNYSYDEFSDSFSANTSQTIILDAGEKITMEFQFIEITDIPEPSTIAIFALAIMSLASRRFKKK